MCPHLGRREIEVRFDAQSSHSGGGSILLGACEGTLGLADARAGGLWAPRQPGKITPTFRERLRQCLVGLALGHAENTDMAGLKGHPRL